jgi:hypothetical protein
MQCWAARTAIDCLKDQARTFQVIQQIEILNVHTPIGIDVNHRRRAGKGQVGVAGDIEEDQVFIHGDHVGGGMEGPGHKRCGGSRHGDIRRRAGPGAGVGLRIEAQDRILFLLGARVAVVGVGASAAEADEPARRDLELPGHRNLQVQVRRRFDGVPTALPNRTLFKLYLNIFRAFAAPSEKSREAVGLHYAPLVKSPDCRTPFAAGIS